MSEVEEDKAKRDELVQRIKGAEEAIAEAKAEIGVINAKYAKRRGERLRWAMDSMSDEERKETEELLHHVIHGYSGTSPEGSNVDHALTRSVYYNVLKIVHALRTAPAESSAADTAGMQRIVETAFMVHGLPFTERRWDAVDQVIAGFESRNPDLGKGKSPVEGVFTPYIDGSECARSGGSIDDCPYLDDDDSRDLWIFGFGGVKAFEAGVQACRDGKPKDSFDGVKHSLEHSGFLRGYEEEQLRQAAQAAS